QFLRGEFWFPGGGGDACLERRDADGERSARQPRNGGTRARRAHAPERRAGRAGRGRRTCARTSSARGVGQEPDRVAVAAHRAIRRRGVLPMIDGEKRRPSHLVARPVTIEWNGGTITNL